MQFKVRQLEIKFKMKEVMKHMRGICRKV